MTSNATGLRRSILRKSTAECHQELEDQMEARGYFEAITSYHDYLQRLHLFYGSFSLAMSRGHADLMGRWQLEHHISWLEADLAHFYLAPLSPAHDPRLTPCIESRSNAFGAAYVVLGSSLGAKLLAVRAARLQPAGGAGLLYLSSLKSSAPWHAFASDLEAESGLDHPGLLDGAMETFATYKAHMTRTIGA